MSQLMYGKNVAKQILSNPKSVHMVYLSGNDQALIGMCVKAKVPYQILDRRVLTKKAGTDRHQGVVLEVDSYQTYSVDELIRNPKGTWGFLVMLDELEDPHNLGAILRTADAVGADGVIFKKNNAVGLNATVAKVSAGAIDTVKCAAVTNLTRTVQELKKKGYWIVGADMDGQDYRTIRYDFPTVLIIGNEGRGISPLLRKQCDFIASLPMTGQIESLNASVSAGILMYSVYSRRFPIGG